MNMADTLQPNVSDTKHLLQEKLSLWDAKLNPKAPLSDRQKDGFIELTTLSANRRLPVEVRDCLLSAMEEGLRVRFFLCNFLVFCYALLDSGSRKVKVARNM